MNLKENQEVYQEQATKYITSMGEIKTDYEIFAERLRAIGKPFVAMKMEAVGAIIECAISHAENLTLPKSWDNESPVS